MAIDIEAIPRSHDYIITPFLLQLTVGNPTPQFRALRLDIPAIQRHNIIW